MDSKGEEVMFEKWEWLGVGEFLILAFRVLESEGVMWGVDK